jgi:L-asparaginase
MQQEIIVLGTGGTIAGTAASRLDNTGYTAAQIGVAALLEGVPSLHDALQGRVLRSEQVAQLDSKDMDWLTMLLLAQRCAHYLAQPQVKGIVITHGTDTLEETAYFLHCTLPAALQAKPVVLTCAMRPATSSEADGPSNLRDAVWLAGDVRARGVMALCAGDVHHAVAVQKIHTYALNAFSSGDTALGEPGVIAQVAQGVVTCTGAADQFFKGNWPLGEIDTARGAIESIVLKGDDQAARALRWPRVEIVLNHAQASGAIVRALMAHSRDGEPVRGMVVAGTGNGTVSVALQSALEEAQAKGVEVVIASRCAWGGVRENAIQINALSAVKARVALSLKLLAPG